MVSQIQNYHPQTMPALWQPTIIDLSRSTIHLAHLQIALFSLTFNEEKSQKKDWKIQLYNYQLVPSGVEEKVK